MTPESARAKGRWAAVLLCLVTLSAPLAANAQPIDRTAAVAVAADRAPENRYLDVIDALERQGYRILAVRQTLLRRVLIRAETDIHLREIVVSRANGGILRDVIVEEYTAVRRWIDDAPPADIRPGDIDPTLLPD
ncbi:MAG: hypothetical protein JJU42_00250 [Rhodobacteraceae bacterium]|nr:hypothetical protein [Paracoccaceae bacterium]